MTKQEILELIKDAKELGLKSIDINGIKVEFNSPNETRINTNQELSAEELVAKPNPYDELTDEEIMFWSSDYGVELAEKRKQEQLDNLKKKQDDPFDI